MPLFRHRLVDDGFQFRRDVSVEATKPSRLLEGDLLEQLLAVFRDIGGPQGQQLVERGGQGVNVRSMIHDDAFAQRLFGSHVS